MLDRLGPGPLANRTESVVARVAIKGTGADLDELVRRQRAIDLGDHLFRESFGADLNNRIQLVGFRLERLAFRGGQHE